ncbi:response regulator transcription factor [Chloroflexota bacterium]
MDRPEILIVAQQPSFVKLLRAWLEEAGYPVIDAFDGPQGLRVFVRHHPTFVIIDVLTQRRDSFDFLMRIRELSQVPIILLSSKGTEADKVQGLLLGADDYLVKPVGQMELLARVEAVLRRASKSAMEDGAFYADDTIAIDSKRHCVYVRGEEIHLTVLEYNLLACLVNHLGQAVRQRNLLDEVWGPEYNGCEYIKWHISRLRRKIEQDPDNPQMVVTVRGVGYRYDPPDTGTNGHRLNGTSSNGWRSTSSFKSVTVP